MAEPSRPLISVAIATRNYGRYLPRALNSVFRSQNPTGMPIQVVVADDGSTDNTRAILADYRQRYPRNLEVVLIRTPEGIGAAKNAALERCRGRTVAILDADDEFLPEKLIRAHRLLEGGAADIVTTDFYHQLENGRRILRSRRNWEEWRTRGNWFWPPSTWAFRNGVVRFNPHSLGSEDLEWMERRWSSLRCQHLDLALSIQHVHAEPRRGHVPHYGLKWESLTPAAQLMGRILHEPHPNEQLVPPVWSCRVCGNQYLLPAMCCGRQTLERPLLFYWTILSPYHPLNPEFSLVILTRNRVNLTQRAVSSILARIPVDFRRDVELIFVDDYSTDGTLEYIRGLAKTHPVKLILTHPGEPFLYARACNRGAHAARGKYLLLLNNDIELRSEDPWGPLRAALRDPRVGVAGISAELQPARRRAEWAAGAHPYPYAMIDLPVMGDFWGMRREVYWELGGIDEAFAGYGHDEVDFQARAQLAHYRVALVRVQVEHELHATFAPLYGRPAIARMEAANRKLLHTRYGRWFPWAGARGASPTGQALVPSSVVIVARNEVQRLRETLARAARDPECRDGSTQIVVVNNGSTDDTALMLEAYRTRLPRCLSVISLPEPVALPRAWQVGRARAVGDAVRVISPGEWRAGPAPVPGGMGTPRPAEPPADGRAGGAAHGQTSAPRAAGHRNAPSSGGELNRGPAQLP
jgi:glycosyltransferase involved in cell wall biosynthesis